MTDLGLVKKICMDGPTLDFVPRGACRGAATSLFYLDRGYNPDLATPKALCSTCSVANECLAWGLCREKFGIWGGQSEKGRIKIRKMLRVELRRPESESEFIRELQTRGGGVGGARGIPFGRRAS